MSVSLRKRPNCCVAAKRRFVPGATIRTAARSSNIRSLRWPRASYVVGAVGRSPLLVESFPFEWDRAGLASWHVSRERRTYCESAASNRDGERDDDQNGCDRERDRHAGGNRLRACRRNVGRRRCERKHRAVCIENLIRS